MFLLVFSWWCFVNKQGSLHVNSFKFLFFLTGFFLKFQDWLIQNIHKIIRVFVNNALLISLVQVQSILETNPEIAELCVRLKDCVQNFFNVLRVKFHLLVKFCKFFHQKIACEIESQFSFYSEIRIFWQILIHKLVQILQQIIDNLQLLSSMLHHCIISRGQNRQLNRLIWVHSFILL